jgi:hypothetical protein
MVCWSSFIKCSIREQRDDSEVKFKNSVSKVYSMLVLLAKVLKDP